RRVPKQPNPLPMLSGMAERAETAAPESSAARGRRLAWSTAIFALATGLSRVLGLIRESVARYYFGTVGAINAFEVAFLIPNTVRALVADAALSSAFVPVFGDLLEKGERKRAWRVASSLFWLVLLGLGGVTALFIDAVAILIATLIQFLLPLPWLRGRDGRLQMVIDIRDPAVRRTFVLMVPITVGLGLINLNAVVDTFFAARLIDKFQAPSSIN